MASADARPAQSAPLLAELADLNAALADAAAAADWDAVRTLDEARYALLESLPRAGLDASDSAVRSVLEQTLALTRSVLEQAVAAQAREAEALRGVQRGHRGSLAYLEACG